MFPADALRQGADFARSTCLRRRKSRREARWPPRGLHGQNISDALRTQATSPNERTALLGVGKQKLTRLAQRQAGSAFAVDILIDLLGFATVRRTLARIPHLVPAEHRLSKKPP
jgi:hypothetical protein